MFPPSGSFWGLESSHMALRAAYLSVGKVNEVELTLEPQNVEQ
jgi:hypothetical protein